MDGLESNPFGGFGWDNTELPEERVEVEEVSTLQPLYHAPKLLACDLGRRVGTDAPAIAEFVPSNQQRRLRTLDDELVVREIQLDPSLASQRSDEDDSGRYRFVEFDYLECLVETQARQRHRYNLSPFVCAAGDHREVKVGRVARMLEVAVAKRGSTLEHESLVFERGDRVQHVGEYVVALDGARRHAFGVGASGDLRGGDH